MAFSLSQRRLRGEVGNAFESLFFQSSTSKVLNSFRGYLHRREARQEHGYSLSTLDLEFVARVATIYLENVRYVRELGRTFGFEVHAFLQPFLLTGYEVEAEVVTPFERDQYFARPERDRVLTRRFYEEVTARGEVVDLSRVFVDEGVAGNYYDNVHLGPEGNRRVADRIYAELTKRSPSTWESQTVVHSAARFAAGAMFD